MDIYDNRAAKLHREATAADAHLDLVTAVYRNARAGVKDSLKNCYVKKLKESGVNLVFASLFLGQEELRDCHEKDAVYKKSMDMLSYFLEELKAAEKEAVLITDRNSLLEIADAKKRCQNWQAGIVLYLEGLDMLEGEPERLKNFYQAGVRGAALTWNKRPGLWNPFAEGCTAEDELINDKLGDKERFSLEQCSQKKKNAITTKGIEVISLMEKWGIFVDCSHLCEAALDKLPYCTKLPYAATHSNAKALAGHPRNMTDDQIRKLSERGGVIGVNTYRDFVAEKYENISAIDGICRQISYLVETAGEDHVGYGLDFGEGNWLKTEKEKRIEDLSGYEQFPKITAQLLRMGYSEGTVRKIMGENWVRYLQRILC